jgi:two-component sensor histidine kinase
MKFKVVFVFAFGLIFQLRGQSDFLSRARDRVCQQIHRNDVAIDRVADSLFQFVGEVEDTRTQAYLYYWKALGFHHSSEQPLDSIAKYATHSQALFLVVEDNEGLFETHTLLGKTLLYLNDWARAERHFSMAKQTADTDFKKFRNHLDYGVKYIFEDRIDSAFKVLHRAEKMLPLLQQDQCWYDYSISELNINLGMSEIRRVDYENTDYEKSINYFKRAINAYGLSRTKGFENYLFCLINLSYCYRKAGFFGVKSVHLDSARYYLKHYIDLVEKSELTDKYGKLDAAYGNLGWQLFAEGKAKEGIYEVQRSKNYLDSMYSDLLEKKALEITNSFENRLKDQEIEFLNSSHAKAQNFNLILAILLFIFFLFLLLLVFTYHRSSQKNKLLTQQQKEIIQVKDQLEVLLQEIHHRIKNNLQVISSFLGIQKRKLKEVEAVDALTQSQLRIQTIAVLHEQLYEQKGLENVAMQFYFEKLTEHIKGNIFFDKKVNFTLAVENHILDSESSLYLGIVLSELVMNALKYAFDRERNNKIKIAFRTTGTQYKLTITDNGKGMPKQLHTQGTGMGFAIVHAMVEKLKGDLKIKSSKGTQITLTIPK